MRHTFLDLFAAPGGLSLGFEMAGFRSIAAIDADKDGMKTYATNFPDAEVITDDVRNVDIKRFMKDIKISPGDVDAVIGGPPCQGFSVAGRVKIASLARNGIWNLTNHDPRYVDDPRNELYRNFIEFVRHIEPTVFVMENVPGILSYRNGETASEIRRRFENTGYRVEVSVLNTVQFGVPQVRRRTFFIGTNMKDVPIRWPRPTHRKPETALHDSSDGDGLASAVTLWEAIGDLPDPVPGRRGLSDEVLGYTMEPFSEYQKWARSGSEEVHNHISRQHSPRDIGVFATMKEGDRWKDLPVDVKRLYGYRDDIFSDKMKRLRRDLPSWTVTAHLQKDGYRYIHPVQPRTITVREAARIQSFPDRFLFCGSRKSQFRQVGNAVPPLLSMAVATSVREMLDTI